MSSSNKKNWKQKDHYRIIKTSKGYKRVRINPGQKKKVTKRARLPSLPRPPRLPKKKDPKKDALSIYFPQALATQDKEKKLDLVPKTPGPRLPSEGAPIEGYEADVRTPIKYESVNEQKAHMLQKDLVAAGYDVPLFKIKEQYDEGKSTEEIFNELVARKDKEYALGEMYGLLAAEGDLFETEEDAKNYENKFLAKWEEYLEKGKDPEKYLKKIHEDIKQERLEETSPTVFRYKLLDSQAGTAAEAGKLKVSIANKVHDINRFEAEAKKKELFSPAYAMARKVLKKEEEAEKEVYNQDKKVFNNYGGRIRMAGKLLAPDEITKDDGSVVPRKEASYDDVYNYYHELLVSPKTMTKDPKVLAKPKVAEEMGDVLVGSLDDNELKSLKEGVIPDTVKQKFDILAKDKEVGWNKFGVKLPSSGDDLRSLKDVDKKKVAEEFKNLIVSKNSDLTTSPLVNKLPLVKNVEASKFSKHPVFEVNVADPKIAQTKSPTARNKLIDDMNKVSKFINSKMAFLHNYEESEKLRDSLRSKGKKKSMDERVVLDSMSEEDKRSPMFATLFKAKKDEYNRQSEEGIKKIPKPKMSMTKPSASPSIIREFEEVAEMGERKIKEVEAVQTDKAKDARLKKEAQTQKDKGKIVEDKIKEYEALQARLAELRAQKAALQEKRKKK